MPFTVIERANILDQPTMVSNNRIETALLQTGSTHHRGDQCAYIFQRLRRVDYQKLNGIPTDYLDRFIECYSSDAIRAILKSNCPAAIERLLSQTHQQAFTQFIEKNESEAISAILRSRNPSVINNIEDEMWERYLSDPATRAERKNNILANRQLPIHAKLKIKTMSHRLERVDHALLLTTFSYMASIVCKNLPDHETRDEIVLKR